MGGEINYMGFKFNKETQTITGYDGDVPKYLTVPDEIDSMPVIKIGAYAFSGVKLDAVILPDSILEIEGCAFDSCGLVYVKFPSNLKRVAQHAFTHNELSRINLPKSIESIGKYAFSTNKLTKLVFNQETLFLEDFSFMCNPLIYIDIDVTNRNTKPACNTFGEEGPDYINGHFKLTNGTWIDGDSISKDPYS